MIPNLKRYVCERKNRSGAIRQGDKYLASPQSCLCQGVPMFYYSQIEEILKYGMNTTVRIGMKLQTRPDQASINHLPLLHQRRVFADVKIHIDFNNSAGG